MIVSSNTYPYTVVIPLPVRTLRIRAGPVSNHTICQQHAAESIGPLVWY
eukprot:SAG11_NODE_1997_length_3945_cov_56.897556_5_plen_49_part_00